MKLGIGAIIVGVSGAIFCAVGLGFGWWFASKFDGRVTRVTARLDLGLSKADTGLARIEGRLSALHSDLDTIRNEAERIASENPELPKVRDTVEQLLNRLSPALDRADVIAGSLQSIAEGLLTASDIANQLGAEPELSGRFSSAADSIDNAAQAVAGLRGRIEQLKLARAAQLTHELATLCREAVAGSERLADGLAAARKAIAGTRSQTTEWRDKIVRWAYVAATASSLFWLWGGLGQVCLIGWGRRRIAERNSATR